MIWDRKFDELMATWDSPVAAEGQTAWRAYSAVTEWEQHYRTGDSAKMAKATILGSQPYTHRAVAALAAL